MSVASLPARRDVRAFGADGLKVGLTRFPALYGRTRRPYATARYLLGRTHEPDYAAFGLLDQTDGLFLDVGANAGMSSMSLRIHQRRAHIMAIEPNPFHEADLRWTRRVVGRMRYGIWAAGDAPGEAELFIPVYRGVPITAEASLTREFVQDSPSLRALLGARMDSPQFEIVDARVEVRRIDDLHLRPAMVKVDVQGHEHPALLGMSQTLEDCGPPVLVEAPSVQTKGLMATLGYAAYRYDAPTDRLHRLGSEQVTNVLFARGLPDAIVA